MPEPEVRALAENLLERLKGRAVYRKWFVRDRAVLSEAAAAEHTRAKPWIGQHRRARAGDPGERSEPRGQALRRLLGGTVPGASRDPPAGAQLAQGRRLLNTFAYTCGFTVAASGRRGGGHRQRGSAQTLPGVG